MSSPKRKAPQDKPIVHQLGAKLDAPFVKQAVAKSYTAFVDGVKERIRTAQVKAALAANAELILLYWEIGREILANQNRQGWGAKVIDRLSADLQAAFPKLSGYSVRNLKYMRAFGEGWPDRSIVQQLVAQLPWGHQCTLLDLVKDEDTRTFYIQHAIKNGWSRAVLVHQIDTELHLRLGVAPNNFSLTLPKPQSDLARELLKDPYLLRPAPLDESANERALENALIARLKDFLLELGSGFAFVGSQVRIEVGGDEFFMDLLFYHTQLHCYIVVDLKVVDFQPEFASKMNFYQAAVDNQMKSSQDAPTIGLILCRGKNKTVVEYTLRDSKSPLGVAEYRLLPSDLKKALPGVQQLKNAVKDLEGPDAN